MQLWISQADRTIKTNQGKKQNRTQIKRDKQKKEDIGKKRRNTDIDHPVVDANNQNKPKFRSRLWCQKYDDAPNMEIR